MGKSSASLTFSYVNDESDLKKMSDSQKIIRMLSKGFCIAVVSGEKKVERLFQYTFNTDNLSVADKLETIETVNQKLKIYCTNNVFRLYTQSNVQIPNEFYDAENDTAVLSLAVENPEKYVPVAEKVEAWNLYNVSAWEKELYLGVKTKFPDYELDTILSSLLSIVENQKKEVLIFVGDNNFTVIATDGKKLLGINTFDFFTDGDFFYYLYGFLRKMYISPSAIPLKLGGNIAIQSSLYNVLDKYFSAVEMLSISPCTIENYSYFCDLV